MEEYVVDGLRIYPQVVGVNVAGCEPDIVLEILREIEIECLLIEDNRLSCVVHDQTENDLDEFKLKILDKAKRSASVTFEPAAVMVELYGALLDGTNGVVYKVLTALSRKKINIVLQMLYPNRYLILVKNIKIKMLANLIRKELRLRDRNIQIL